MAIRRLFPGFWLGPMRVLALGVAPGRTRIALTLFLWWLASAAVIGVLVLRKLVRDLADDVRHGGGHLLVRRGGVAECAALTSVLNVSINPIGPPRVSLRLWRPGRLGDKVVSQV